MRQTRASGAGAQHEIRRRARGGRRPAEEGDEDVLHVGVLVDEHRQQLALPERPEQRHRRPGLSAPHVPHPAVRAEAVDEPGEPRVDVLLAHRVQRKAVPGHAPGVQLPVAEVGRDADPALPARVARSIAASASPEQSTSASKRSPEPRRDRHLHHRGPEVAEAAAGEVQPRLLGHLGKGHREAGQRLAALAGARWNAALPDGAAERLRPPERQATEDRERDAEEPVAESSLQALGQGWCHRGKRGVSYGTAGVELRRTGGPHPQLRRTLAREPGLAGPRGQPVEPARGRAAGAPEDALRRRARRGPGGAPAPPPAVAADAARAGLRRHRRAGAGAGGERGRAFLLRLCSSAASMWAANAATGAPSSDTGDGRMHLTVANLQAMFHRVLEADTTTRGAPRHLRRRAALRRARAAARRRSLRRRGRGEPHPARGGRSAGDAPLRLGPEHLASGEGPGPISRPGRRARPRTRWPGCTSCTPTRACFRSRTRQGSTAARSTPT